MFNRNNNEENSEKAEKNEENSEKTTEESQNKYKIDKKTAELEFDNFCEMWDIDNDIDSMSEEDKEGFNRQKTTLVKAIRQGRLILDKEKKTLLYTISEYSEKAGEQVVIRRMRGEDLMNSDKYKEGELIRKTYAIISSMTHLPISYIASLDTSDLKVLQTCMILFMQG